MREVGEGLLGAVGVWWGREQVLGEVELDCG